MSQNILTTNTVCVETIHSDSDLEIYSNRKIYFDTPNMLIRDLHFENYIENTVFGSSLFNGPHDYKISGDSNEINTSQMGEYDLEMVDCLEVSSSQSFQVLSESGSYSNMEHYVNLRAESNLVIRSTNIFVESESFDDFVYRLVNKKSDSNIDTETIPSIAIVPADRFNVTDFGTYFTKKINCNKISTENIYIERSGSNEEPVLNINSRSAVNLQSLNILIDDSNTGSNVDLDTYLKTRLDESRYFLEIFIIPESGVDISFTFNQQADGDGFNHYWKDIDVFTYKINFKIVPTGEVPTDDTPSNNVLDEILTPQASDAPTYEYIKFEFTPDTRYTLSNLEPGNFYDIYADVTNLFTNTTVYNILTDGVNIPTIKHVVIQNDGVNSIVVVNENTIKIRYTPHETYIASWNTPDKLVYFAAKLIEPIGYTNTINQTPGSTGNTFNLSDRNIADRNAHYLEFTLDISQFTDGTTSYGDYLKVSGDNTTKTTDLHSFSIVSTHSSGTFEMISPSVDLTPFNFGPPATPTNFSMNYFTTNVFNWTLSANTVATTRIENIYYDVYRTGRASNRLNDNDLLNSNALSKPNTNNVLQNDGGNLDSLPRGSRIGFIADTYKIQAYNVFGQRSGFVTKTITNLSVTRPTWSVPTSANRQWTVSYSVSSNNGSYSITSNKSPVSSYGTSSFLTTLGFGNQVVYVDVQDTAMRLRSQNSTITIYTPIININNGVFDNSIAPPNRDYKFTYNITTRSYTSSGPYNVYSVQSVTNITQMTLQEQTVSYIKFKVNNPSSSSIILSGGYFQKYVNVSFNLKVRDSYGYDTIDTLKNYSVLVRFDNIPSITISNSSNREFIITSALDQNPTLHYSKTYQWYVNGHQVSTSSSTGIIDDAGANGNNKYFGQIYCNVVFRNLQGFTRHLKSVELTNSLPTISGNSASIDTTSSYIYTYIYDSVGYNTGSTTYATRISKGGTVITNSDYSDPGLYIIEVYIVNDYGFGAWIQIGTFTVVAPSNPQIISIKAKTINSIELNLSWDNGTYPNGNPSEVSTNTLYYSQSSFTTSSLPSTKINYNQDKPIVGTVNSLSTGTPYFFMLEKNFPRYSDTYSTPIFSATTVFLPPEPVTIHDESQPLQPTIVTHNTIHLNWSAPNNNGNSVVYSIFIKTAGGSYYEVASNLTTTSYSITTFDGTNLLNGLTDYTIYVRTSVSPNPDGIPNVDSNTITFKTTFDYTNIKLTFDYSNLSYLDVNYTIYTYFSEISSKKAYTPPNPSSRTINGGLYPYAAWSTLANPNLGTLTSLNYQDIWTNNGIAKYQTTNHQMGNQTNLLHFNGLNINNCDGIYVSDSTNTSIYDIDIFKDFIDRMIANDAHITHDIEYNISFTYGGTTHSYTSGLGPHIIIRLYDDNMTNADGSIYLNSQEASAVIIDSTNVKPTMIRFNYDIGSFGLPYEEPTSVRVYYEPDGTPITAASPYIEITDYTATTLQIGLLDYNTPYNFRFESVFPTYGTKITTHTERTANAIPPSSFHLVIKEERNTSNSINANIAVYDFDDPTTVIGYNHTEQYYQHVTVTPWSEDWAIDNFLGHWWYGIRSDFNVGDPFTGFPEDIRIYYHTSEFTKDSLPATYYLANSRRPVEIYTNVGYTLSGIDYSINNLIDDISFKNDWRHLMSRTGIQTAYMQGVENGYLKDYYDTYPNPYMQSYQILPHQYGRHLNSLSFTPDNTNINNLLPGTTYYMMVSATWNHPYTTPVYSRLYESTTTN